MFRIFLVLLLALSTIDCKTAETPPIDALPLAVSDCVVDTVVHGIDVSEHQGDINWSQVAGAGFHFAFIRVSDGTTHPDSYFESNWAEARDAGLIRGAYQYFRPSQSAVAQADLLIDAIGTLEPNDLPPVIDVETDSGLAPSTVASQVGAWVERVESRLGVRPIIYTMKYFWQDEVGSDAFSDYPLWLASWYRSGWSGRCPNTPDQWSEWVFWQWTDEGSSPGISGFVDRNVFRGTLADLDTWTVSGGSTLTLAEPYDGATAANPVSFRFEATPEISRVRLVADSLWEFADLTERTGAGFETAYSFTHDGLRNITAEAYNEGGTLVDELNFSINVSDTATAFALVEPTDGSTLANPVRFRFQAPPEILRVRLVADELWEFANLTERTDGLFEILYTFSHEGLRNITAEAYTDAAAPVQELNFTITVVEAPAPFELLEPNDGDTVTNPVRFRFDAPSEITRVRLVADSLWEFANLTERTEGVFELLYSFSSQGLRNITAEGYDSDETLVDTLDFSLTVGEGVWLDVPYYYQLHNTNEPYRTCNITSVAMALSYETVAVTPDEIYVAYGGPVFTGTAMRNIARDYGATHSTYHAGGVGKARVKEYLDLGIPVIFQGQFTGGSGHIVLIVGYDDTGWWVNDPYGEWNSWGYTNEPTVGDHIHYSYNLVDNNSLGGWDNYHITAVY